ncbi:MAG: HAD-IIIA family hydrolase [Candidatus Schekmanbacteria bacterium]|nr:MAG: HAD-IIIA family hydrolase [Candidatus Schekmanbacteria bacterium]
MKESLINRIKRIKIIIFDIDGVMTDGKIIYSSNGEEIKEFNVRDGHGIKLAKRAGMDIAVISGRASKILSARVKELGIDKHYQKALRKIEAYEDILRRYGYKDEETAYVGDDLPDIPVMRRCGFSIAVRDAVDEVKESAHLITQNCGGNGAVREVVDLILKTQGRWSMIMERYEA